MGEVVYPDFGGRNMDVEAVLRLLANIPRGHRRDNQSPRVPAGPTGARLTAPEGWVVANEGIFKGDRQVARAMVIIQGLFCSLTGGPEFVQLAWKRRNHWQSTVVERMVIASSSKVVQLASLGFPVTSREAGLLVEYLADFEAANQHSIPIAYVSDHLGWQGKDLEKGFGFLWGHNYIEPRGRTITTADEAQPCQENSVVFKGKDPGSKDLVLGLHARGSFEGWQDAIASVAKHPTVLLALCGSLSAPMLSILSAPNFAIDFSYETSRGKTTLLRAAASCWGNPDETKPDSIMGSWDVSTTYVERANAVANGLPLILDDTKRAARPEVVSDVIYQVTNGRGKGRGSISGIQEVRSWNTVLLSTGESPAAASSRHEGIRARILTVWGPPFGETNPQTAKEVGALNRLLKENYGHAGPRFIQFLQGERDEWASWRRLYLDKVAYYQEKAGNNAILCRLAEYAAVLRLTAELATQALDLVWDIEVMMEVLWNSAASEINEDGNQARKALELVYNWACSKRGQFFGRGGSGKKEWVGRWDDQEDWEWIGFLPQRLDQVLKSAGLDPQAVKRIWREKGWLDVAGDRNRYTKKVRIGNCPTPPYMVVINRTAFELL